MRVSLAAVALVLVARDGRADTVFCADGRVLRGVVSQDGERLRLAVENGVTFLRPAEVARVHGGPAARAAWEARRATAPPTTAAAHLRLAREAELAGLDAEARAGYQAALAADPTSLEPLQCLSALTVADLAWRIAAAEGAARDALVAELRPHGEPGILGLQRVFDERLAFAREYLALSGGGAKLSEKARASFEAARAAVLKLVLGTPQYQHQGKDSELAHRANELAGRVFALAKQKDFSAALGADEVLDRHLRALRALADALREVAGAAGRADADVEGLLEGLRKSLEGADLTGGVRNSHAEDNAIVRQANAAYPDLTPLERQGIDAVNWYREILGLRILKVNPQLLAAARRHTQKMVADGFFSHFSKEAGYREPWDRAVRAGYPARTVGENLAQQIGAPLDGMGACRAWIISPPHHYNMLVREYVDIGIGVEHDTWTLMLGIPRR